MRHINFYPTATELKSLDGFNHGTTFTKALVGDSSCTLRSYETRLLFSEYANYAVPGLPVFDGEVKRALEAIAPKVDKVFLFPATELHGCCRFDDLNMTLPWNERWLEFQDADRYCYNGREYQHTSHYDKTSMTNNYLDFIGGLLTQYPNLHIVPNGNRWYSERFPQFFGVYETLKGFDRCLNLDWLLPTDLTFWADKQGHISHKTFEILKQQIDALPTQ